MKAFIISLLTLFLTMGLWFVFFQQASSSMDSMLKISHDQVMAAMEKEDWDTANTSFQEVHKNWKAYRSYALYFLDTDKVNDIDCTFAKTKMYIKAEDLSNGSGELLNLENQLYQLHSNEHLTLKNIL